jgi:streptogramin lyase
MRIPFNYKVAAGVATLALAACGGGGNGSIVPSQPGHPSPLPGSPVGAQSVSFVVNVPAASSNAGSVRIAVQSVNGTSTASGSATVARIASSAAGCTAAPKGLTCTIAVPASSGLDVFNVSTYQSQDGSGSVLASTTVAANVGGTATQSIALSVGGVPARVAFSPSRLPLVADGTIHRVAVTLNVADASGATIVGASDYQSPVSLQIVNDPAHALSLSTSSVGKPGEVVTVTYDSSKQLAQAQIVANDNAMAPATLVAAPLTVNPAPVVIFDDATSAAVTLSEAGFTGAFSASLSNPNDASLSVVPGTLNSGSSVATLVPKVRFDSTTLNVSDGNMTYAVPAWVVPHNSAYSAFGSAHTILIPSLNMVESSDGKLWSGDQNDGSIVSFDPSTGTYSRFVVDPGLTGPQSVALDASGNVWFADGSQIGEYTPSTSAVNMFSTGLQPSARITTIVPGKAGTMWFYDYATNSPLNNFGHPTFFGTIDTTTGQIQEYPVNNAQPAGGAITITGMSMAVANDNSIWFADGWNYSVGHLDPATGNVQEFKLTRPTEPQDSPMQIVIAPDGKVWAAAYSFTSGHSVIASVDPSNGNAITYYTDKYEAPGPFLALTRGSDGNLWFVEDPLAGFGYSSQTALGVMNPATGAFYQYATAIPDFATPASLVDRGDGTLWILDPAFGQIGKVTFK